MDGKTIETGKVGRLAVDATTVAVLVDVDNLPTAEPQLEEGSAVGSVGVEGKQLLRLVGNRLWGVLRSGMAVGDGVCHGGVGGRGRDC